MIIVAYLYNTNGMASWCWEAAHALAESGQEVVLICAPDAAIPDTTLVKIVRFALPKSTLHGNKISREFGRLSDKSSGFVFALHSHLQTLGIVASAYLLNQSDLLDGRVEVPQHVVAWAYPTTLLGYLGKIGKLTGWKFSFNTLRILFDAVGWWRKDWRSYRSATSVLAVSERLNASLKAQGINSSVVYPGTALLRESSPHTAQAPYKLLTVAVGLEDPRKRVLWLVEALRQMPDWSQFSLTLIGNTNSAFRERVCRDGFPATFTGPLGRQEVQEKMADFDLFLFGSELDDWGYVLVEAMSRNLCTIAPNISPFDEIVGDTGVLYNVNSQTDLTQKLSALLAEPIGSYQQAATQRAETLFSRAAFSRSLLAMMKTAEAV